MARTTGDEPARPYVPKNDFAGRGVFNRLNAFLFRYIGPPPLGPFDEAPVAEHAPALCPVCGAPMADHEIDRTSGVAKLYCPDAPPSNRTAA